VENKLLNVRWPALNKEVVVKPLTVNVDLFSWFLKNTPCKSIQGHAVVSGDLIYTKTIQIQQPATLRYHELEFMLLNEAPIGMVFINVSRKRSGTIMIKYGDITENMPYPVIGQVRREDLGVIQEVGSNIWDAFYNTKEIITCQFEGV